MEEKLDLILNIVKDINQEVNFIKQKVKDIDEKITSLEANALDSNRRIIGIEMTIENAIKPNIMRVAEGHIDISTNIGLVKNTVEQINGKIEMHSMLLNIYKDDVQQIKRKIEEIA